MPFSPDWATSPGSPSRFTPSPRSGRPFSVIPPWPSVIPRARFCVSALRPCSQCVCACCPRTKWPWFLRTHRCPIAAAAFSAIVTWYRLARTCPSQLGPSEFSSTTTVLTVTPLIQLLPVSAFPRFSTESFRAGISPISIFRFRCGDLYCCCSPPWWLAPLSAVGKSITFIFRIIFRSFSQAPT